MSFILPNQTSFAIAKPTYSGSTWVRPSDWISITDTAGEIQFLVSDVVYPTYAIQTTFTRPGAQNIYIDWGDGVVDTISTTTATITNHTYSAGTGTPCSRGYTTWKVRIYGDVGTTITEATHLANTTYWAGLQGQIGLLEEYYGNGTITTAQYLHQTSTNRPRTYFLEYSKLPAVMNAAAPIFNETYASCINLQKIVLPTSAPNATSIRSMIGGCVKLEEIVLPQDMINVVDCNSFASNSYSLNSVILPPTMNSSTDWTSAFQNCYSLGSIQMPTTNAATNFSSTFSGCRSLLNVEIKSWSSAITTINLAATFNGCSALEDVKLPPSIAAGATLTMTQTFLSCLALKSFTSFPINFNTTSLSQTFQGCSSLSYVALPSSIPGLTSMANTFNACSQLARITLPTTIGASIDLNQAFLNCTGISEITIPSGYSVNNFNTTFQGATALKRLSLPPVAPVGMANMCSGCISLEQIVMPTNMTTTQLMGSAFSNCQSLESLTFPSPMNSVSSMNGTFSSCFNLKSITLPTSMTGCNNWSSTFSSCYSLKSVVLPATSNATNTTYASCFTQCFSLESITLPTTQSLLVNTIAQFGNSLFNLTGITNTQFIGNNSTAAGNTTYVDGTSFFTNTFRLSTPVSFSCKFSKLIISGFNASRRNGLSSLRLLNNGAGQYGGTSPQIDIRYTNLSQAALVQVFNDLPTITAKTIDITDALGAASLTPAERAIATGKGWTILG